MPSRQDDDLKYANKLVAVLEEKLEQSELKVDEYRRFCEEIVSSDEKDLTHWKRRAQFALDAMKPQIRLSDDGRPLDKCGQVKCETPGCNVWHNPEWSDGTPRYGCSGNGSTHEEDNAKKHEGK